MNTSFGSILAALAVFVKLIAHAQAQPFSSTSMPIWMQFKFFGDLGCSWDDVPEEDLDELMRVSGPFFLQNLQNHLGANHNVQTLTMSADKPSDCAGPFCCFEVTYEITYATPQDQNYTLYDILASNNKQSQTVASLNLIQEYIYQHVWPLGGLWDDIMVVHQVSDGCPTETTRSSGCTGKTECIEHIDIGGVVTRGAEELATTSAVPALDLPELEEVLSSAGFSTTATPLLMVMLSSIGTATWMTCMWFF